MSTTTAVLAPSAAGTLSRLFRSYRGRILATYALFNLENGVRLLEPWLLGLAIDGLLRSSPWGLILLMVQHLTFLGLGTVRRMYDTRAFTSIYTDLASAMVHEQRQQNIDVSRVAARSALSREIVMFFEREIPFVFYSLSSIIGALAYLILCDGWLTASCLGLLVVVGLVSRNYARQTAVSNRQLNDRLEHEVDVIQEGQPDKVRQHYECVAFWRIRLSDQEAYNFGFLELCILGLLAVGLMRACAIETDAGKIVAVFSYVLMFVSGIANVPMLAQQVTRLQDISRRLKTEETPRQ
jgi:hypothetical protein